MSNFRRFSKSSLVWLILFASTVSFLAGLFAVLAFQSKYLVKDRIENAVTEAERLTTIDKSITTEGALKLFSGNLKFGMFDTNCSPYYVTDLMLHSESCKTSNSRFSWFQILTPKNNTYRIGFSSKLSLIEYIQSYQSILITTLCTYLVFILFLTLVLFRVFIKNPIHKISNTIDVLLNTKQLDINTFDQNSNSILASLYSSVSRLLKEVVKFKQEEEKLILSRQISHDLRAPISILEERFMTFDPNSIEYLAFKRLKDITNELMPTSNVVNETINLISMLDEFKLVYSQISFHLDLQVKELNNQSLAISETDLYRFLSNIIKNSIEATSKNIFIQIIRDDTFFKISIRDDGVGNSPDKNVDILKGYSSKDDGHGLGISSIQRKLQEVGGSVDIQTSLDSGFMINLKIPFLIKDEITWILIDDDKLIRINWSAVAKRKGVKVICFSSIDEFLKNHNDLPITSHIYIDSDLGNGLKGEMESERISKLGFSNIYLATSYNKSDFNLASLPWIKDIFSKVPPF